MRKAIDYEIMPSGAGHDAMQMAKITPAGMIFIPSRRGISHNPLEWTDPDGYCSRRPVTDGNHDSSRAMKNV